VVAEINVEIYSHNTSLYFYSTSHLWHLWHVSASWLSQQTMRWYIPSMNKIFWVVRVIFSKVISWGERRCDFTLIATLPSLSSLPVPRSIPVSLSSSPSHRLYIRIRFIGIFIRIYFKWKSKLESNNFILIIILSLHLFFPSYSLYFYLISNPIDYPLRRPLHSSM